MNFSYIDGIKIFPYMRIYSFLTNFCHVYSPTNIQYKSGSFRNYKGSKRNWLIIWPQIKWLDHVHLRHSFGRASGRSRKKSQISWDFQGQIRGKNGRFRGNFAGIFEASFVEKRLVKNGRFRESFPSKFRWKPIGFALIWGKFPMKLDALIDLPRLHTTIWKRTIQVSVLNIIKTNKRIRILKTHLLS